ncbi:MAG: glycerol-3-phosphate 1-O-acyltransferase PlsY [Bacteroidales bacterium]|nr:glycerol-3-phosphate 1-O-acyltransferase PlsY [Bacteroidales bacterium]HOK99355.1 glycerol-3-phosphate 1-O-acyltransferase PlsY [Bacteroidales bacterium]HPO66216.1 glycerol-3-phosphate 1-O-acyltransferase PlsY [Bacteroidales bacterium]
MIYFLLIFIAYLLGSIPTSVWAGKWFYGIDIREHGSGNAGATNTLRVLGWKAGIPVFLIDIAKGFVAVSLVSFLDFSSGSNSKILYQLALGFAALLGHVFPIFAQFKGGKGVATLLGVVLALSPIPALLAFGIFVVVLIISKYVSLGSMIAAIGYALMIIFIFPSPISLKIAASIMALAVILTHRKNIQRLINKTENKATFLFKK